MAKQLQFTEFKYVDTLLISDISKDISEFLQFIGITMLFTVTVSVTLIERRPPARKAYGSERNNKLQAPNFK